MLKHNTVPLYCAGPIFAHGAIAEHAHLSLTMLTPASYSLSHALPIHSQLGLDYAPLAKYLKDGDFRKVCANPYEQPALSQLYAPYSLDELKVSSTCHRSPHHGVTCVHAKDINPFANGNTCIRSLLP